MVNFDYPVLHPIRLLLPVSATFITIPCIFREQFMNYYSFPIFYFFGSYFFFINFPSLSEMFHKKPIYIDDLIIRSQGLTIDTDKKLIDDNSFRKLYNVAMNCILSILFASFSEYVILQGVKTRSIIEICGIIGGNISLYIKVQNSIGKILLKVFYTQKERRKRTLSNLN